MGFLCSVPVSLWVRSQALGGSLWYHKIKSNYLSWLRRCGALNAFFTLDIWLGAHFLSSSLPAWKPPLRAPPTCNYVAARHTHTGTHTDTQLHTQLHTGTAGWRALNSWHTIFNTKYMYGIYTYIVAIVSDVVSIYIYIYISVLFGLGARKCIFNDIFSWHVTSLAAAAAAPHESFARTANFHFSFLFSFVFWLSSSFDFSANFYLYSIKCKWFTRATHCANLSAVNTDTRVQQAQIQMYL